MKIATMVRSYLPSPRPSDIVYAPIDLAMQIAERMVARGHSVDYFGPNSTTVRGASVQTLNLRPLAQDATGFKTVIEATELTSHYLPGLWDGYLAREMFARAARGQYDLLHFHHPETALPYVHLYPDVPVIYTLHEALEPLYREILEMYETPNQYYVSVSNNQRSNAPDLPYIATVYNGINAELFELSEEHDDYLLFVGRIVHEKGVREAIKVAQMTDHRLIIIGPIHPGQEAYFEQHVQPYLNDKIVYLGFIKQDDLPKYFQRAKALLMPIQWEEPFGMTMAEAMCCGTPVIAFGRGSVKEVLRDGVSGYVVDSVSEMADVVIGKIDQIKPRDCHEHIMDKFTFDHMVNGYEKAYKKVLRTFRQRSSS